MIRRLRRRLVAVTMLCLFLVLAAIMGAVNVINYQSILTGADSTLALLRDGGGAFPKFQEFHGGPGSPAKKQLPPELPYESRYFSVQLSAGGGNPLGGYRQNRRYQRRRRRRNRPVGLAGWPGARLCGQLPLFAL